MIVLGRADHDLEAVAAKVGFDPKPPVVLKSSFVAADEKGFPAVRIEPLPDSLLSLREEVMAGIWNEWKFLDAELRKR